MNSSISINPERFAQLIKEKCGFSVGSVDLCILSNAIQARMLTNKIQDADIFFNLLLQDTTELIKIVNSLTVNETYFFRESHHFSLLSKHIIPRILKNARQSPIKLVVMGCATGEEPYTIAISLVEEFGLGILNAVEIYAADIDSTVIQKARKGIYGKHSFRKIDPQILEKYFNPLPDQSYEVREPIKSIVHFNQLNLLNRKYPDSLHQADVIFYRNVSIYFSQEAQKIVLKKLAKLLVNDGYLILSSTETYSHNVGILTLKELDGSFVFRKVGKQKKSIHKTKIQSKPKSCSISPAKSRSLKSEDQAKKNRRRPSTIGNKLKETTRPIKAAEGKDVFGEALAKAKLKKYKQALSLLEEQEKIEPFCIKSRVLQASVLLNLGRIEEAEEVCREALKIEDLNFECVLLLGIIAREKGNDSEAIKQLKAAIFIQSSAWFPHYYMAQLYESKNDYASAKREFGVTIRLVQQYGIDLPENLLLSFSFSGEGLIHLCECNRKIMMSKKILNRKS